MRDRAADRRLMRYLHGELPAKDVRELRAELARNPALQARLAELHRLWQGLQPSPPTPAPFGYVPKLQRLAEQKRTTATATRVVGWGMPSWVGALAAAALVAGVVLGVGLGRMPRKAQSMVAEGRRTAVSASSPASARGGVGASAAPSTADGSEAAAGPSASASPIASATRPRTPDATATAQGESSPTSSATELAEAITGDDTVALADGGSTLAEEYWQALEGLDEGGDGGGGEGDAGW